MVFLQGLREISENEVNREFQSQRQHVGSSLLKDHDIERIQMARKASEKARKHIRRSQDRERYSTVAYAAHLEGEERGRAVTRSFTLSTPSHIPSYDVYQNDLWSMRRHALQKFQNAGNVIVVRLRCGGRLAQIKRFLKQALNVDSTSNMTRAQVKDLVARDNRLAAAGVSLSRQLNEAAEANAEASNTNGGNTNGGHALPPQPTMDLPCMPTVSGGGGGGGGGGGAGNNSIDVTVPTGFDHLRAAVLRLPAEAGLYNHGECGDGHDCGCMWGYSPVFSSALWFSCCSFNVLLCCCCCCFCSEPIPLPAIRLYAPIEMNRALRTGAQEEESVRVQAKIPHQMILDAVATKGDKNGGDKSGESKEAGGEDVPAVDEESTEVKDGSAKKTSGNVLSLPSGAVCWGQPV